MQEKTTLAHKQWAFLTQTNKKQRMHAVARRLRLVRPESSCAPLCCLGRRRCRTVLPACESARAAGRLAKTLPTVTVGYCDWQRRRRRLRLHVQRRSHTFTSAAEKNCMTHKFATLLLIKLVATGANANTVVAPNQHRCKIWTTLAERRRRRTSRHR